MDKSYISIKDLSKKFNENKIINNLSIEIDKGDLVKISGIYTAYAKKQIFNRKHFSDFCF